MRIETDFNNASYIASNVNVIFGQNMGIDPGSGTAECGAYSFLRGTQENIWDFENFVSTGLKIASEITTCDLPEILRSSLQENISDSPFDSSTSEEDFLREDLSRIIQIIFNAGKNEQFEDGIKSDFSVAIKNILINYQDYAIKMLSEYLTSNKIDSGLLCETLRTLGNLQDSETEQIRFQILIPYLSHPSPFIRDCTGLALYDLESPNAIPYIRKAIDKELYQSLKMDFKKIISELQEIKSAQVDPAT